MLTGVSFSDDDYMLHHLDIFAQRIHQMVDLIETLKQLHKFAETSKDLPRLTEEQWRHEKDVADASESEDDNEDEEDTFCSYDNIRVNIKFSEG